MMIKVLENCPATRAVLFYEKRRLVARMVTPAGGWALDINELTKLIAELMTVRNQMGDQP